MVACLLGGSVWLISNRIGPSLKNLWLLIPFVFFAVVTFLQQEPLTIFLGFMFMSESLHAQKRISIESAIDTALKYNQQLLINQTEISKAKYLVKSSNEIPKTGLFAENEDYQPSNKEGILKIGLSQSIAYPGVYKAKKDYFNQQLKLIQLNTKSLYAIIQRDVRSVYYELDRKSTRLNSSH